jgi:hypothetical protein
MFTPTDAPLATDIHKRGNGAMSEDQDPKDTEGHKKDPRAVVQDDDTEGHKHHPYPATGDDDSDVEGHKHNRGA